MLSLTNIIAYSRAETGEIDASKVDDLQIIRYVNFSQLKVQSDVSQVGFKFFTKTLVNTGATFVEPSDLLSVPNSIINLLASTGTVRAFKTISYVTPTAAITHTYKEPGTGGNSITISCDGGTFATPAVGAVSCVLAGGIFYIDFGIGSTITQIITALNADPVYSQYFIASSGTTGSTIPAPAQGTQGLLATGAGGNYYPADEVSHENFVRIESNAFKVPSSTSPKYRRIGNANGKLIEVLPATVNYTQIEYYYRLADLSATTDTLKVPAELEELVLLDVQKRIYEKVGKANEMTAVVNEYNDKFSKWLESYAGKRKVEINEKERLQSADVNN
jgi:hypothetical protein